MESDLMPLGEGLPSPEELFTRINDWHEPEPRLAALYQMEIAGRASEVVTSSNRKIGNRYRPQSRDAYHLNITGEECVMFMVRTAKTADLMRGLEPRLRGVALPLKYDKVAEELFEYFQEVKVPWSDLLYGTYRRRCQRMFRGFQYFVDDYDKLITSLVNGYLTPEKTVKKGKEVNFTEPVPTHLRDAATHIIRHVMIQRRLHHDMKFTGIMLQLYAGHTGKTEDAYKDLTKMQRRYLHLNPRSTPGLEERVVESLAILASQYLPNIIQWHQTPKAAVDVEIIKRLG